MSLVWELGVKGAPGHVKRWNYERQNEWHLPWAALEISLTSSPCCKLSCTIHVNLWLTLTHTLMFLLIMKSLFLPASFCMMNFSAPIFNSFWKARPWKHACIKQSISETWNVLLTIRRSWVQTLLPPNLGCREFLLRPVWTKNQYIIPIPAVVMQHYDEYNIVCITIFKFCKIHDKCSFFIWEKDILFRGIRYMWLKENVWVLMSSHYNA